MADLSIQGALAPLSSAPADSENARTAPFHADRDSALQQTRATLRNGVKMPKVNDKPVVIRLDAVTRDWLVQTAQTQDRSLSYVVAKMVEKACAEDMAKKAAQKEAQHG